jgi:hypothetical protein
MCLAQELALVLISVDFLLSTRGIPLFLLAVRGFFWAFYSVVLIVPQALESLRSEMLRRAETPWAVSNRESSLLARSCF